MIVITKEIPIQFLKDINLAVKVLKEAGCTEIYIFGSIARGDFNEFSDIDIAVKGLNKNIFFKISGNLLMILEHDFDLVDLDDKNNSFCKFIMDKEVFINVA